MKESSLSFDKHVPTKLRKTQQWFASILLSPIDEDSRMNPVSPTGESMEEEAFDYIVPSPSLRPAQRIQLYHQQYWWRLFSCLHEVLPLVTRLFGYHDFNITIAKPYLEKYPPNTWSLNELADRLPQWMEEEYHAQDKQLVLDAVRLDLALNASFFIKHYPPVDAQSASKSPEMILQQKLCLQPHAHLFDMRYDLMSFRKEMLKQEVEYWMQNDFPKLPQDRRHYFVIYRNTSNQVHCEEISASAYRLLGFFSGKGATIEEACDWLEHDEELFKEASTHLHLWFQEWIFRQWLYPESC